MVESGTDKWMNVKRKRKRETEREREKESERAKERDARTDKGEMDEWIKKKEREK